MLPRFAFANGQVRGKIAGLEHLLNPVWQEAGANDGRHFYLREASPTVRSEYRNLFAHAPKEVCVAVISTKPQDPPALPLLITIGGGRTSPVTVVTAPGTRFHFENHDLFASRLFAVGQATFPPVDIPSMAGRDWTASIPGTYELRDETAPSVRSWIVVDANVAAIAYPTTAGAFVIPAIVSGQYTLKVFFGGSIVGETVRMLSVPEGGVVDVSVVVHSEAKLVP